MPQDLYGTHETNGLTNGPAYHNDRHSQPGGVPKVRWTEPGLEVTRLRLLSDPGYPRWDVSYCHGILNGKHVDVILPFSDLPKMRYKAAIVKHAQRDGINAKRIGVFSAISTLN